MVIEITFNGELLTLEVTANQLRQLEDAVVMGKRFIKLGDENFNIDFLERWKVVGE